MIIISSPVPCVTVVTGWIVAPRFTQVALGEGRFQLVVSTGTSSTISAFWQSEIPSARLQILVRSVSAVGLTKWPSRRSRTVMSSARSSIV